MLYNCDKMVGIMLKVGGLWGWSNHDTKMREKRIIFSDRILTVLCIWFFILTGKSKAPILSLLIFVPDNVNNWLMNDSLFLSIYIQNFSGYCRLKGLDVNGRKKCWLFPISFSRFIHPELLMPQSWLLRRRQLFFF